MRAFYLNSRIVDDLLKFSPTEAEIKKDTFRTSIFGITVKDVDGGRAYVATNGRILGYVLDEDPAKDDGIPEEGISLCIAKKLKRYYVELLDDGTAKINNEIIVKTRNDDWGRYSKLIETSVNDASDVCSRYMAVDGKYLKTIQDFLGNTTPYYDNNRIESTYPLVFYGRSNELALLAPMRQSLNDKFDVKL